MNEYEYKTVKIYKNYEIQKAWRVDFDNKKIPNTTIYAVCDDDDCIGEEYKTLKEAQSFIDSIS